MEKIVMGIYVDIIEKSKKLIISTLYKDV